MRSYFAVLSALAVFSGGFAASPTSADPPVAKRIIKPGIVVPAVQGQFKLRVQKTARFPKAERPRASVPANSNGLAITVQPEKKEFAGNGPLALEVTLKNVSPAALRLVAAEVLGGTPKLVISNQKTAAQWTLAAKLSPPKNSLPVALPPGKSQKYTVVVEAQWVVPPRPIPLPRPLPGGIQQPRRVNGKGNAAPRAQQRGGRPIIRPIGPPIVVSPLLPCGQGPCRGRLLLEFPAGNNPNNAGGKVWSGKLASGTFDFEVGRPEIWTPGQPLSKSAAIRIAHPLAERTLSATYKPVAGLRPPKTGVWIENPEKTAAAKKDTTGNWTIGWTHFPKRGHSYNITIVVSRFGGASVREVFTGYSRAP